MIRVGILFGGQSREREVSFAGGRTVYDNLNKQLFEPVPIFIDSLGQFILLDWSFIYKGTIRDFYPAPAYQPREADRNRQFQYYIESLADRPQAELDAIAASVGRKLRPDELPGLMDLAFLCLHGPYGEDGAIQGLLEWYGIPYTGSGVLPSAIGIDKLVQGGLMTQAGFARPRSLVLQRQAWLDRQDRERLLHTVVAQLGLPLVVKAPRQGSSIGITILEDATESAFEQAVNRAFFIEEIQQRTWQKQTPEQKHAYLQHLTDIRGGIGLPVAVSPGPGGAISASLSDKAQQGSLLFHRPEELLDFLDSNLYTGTLVLEALDGEDTILFESFIRGKEFSCIVVRGEEGQAIALPPTQIIKTGNLFDYRSKYLPGMSRKVTPIDVAAERIELIRQRCADLFEALRFNTYARIDGFITEAGEVFLNDPNTTSGMMPSSFFFHQAAEIGLNPSQFLTYIIRQSLAERLQTGKRLVAQRALLRRLDEALARLQERRAERRRVAVIMGGYSAERHISVESGRNVFEKLASSAKYEAIPVFLTGDAQSHELYLLPINVMLKDNADDIREKVLSKEPPHPVLVQIREEAAGLTEKYAGQALAKAQKVTYAELARMVDVAFIALHGRPGEDGVVQQELERVDIPYNGSGPASSRITINKYETNELLARHGVRVARHTLVHRADWEADAAAVVARLEQDFGYPLIAKPCDDGCSAAVKKIKNRGELEAFARLILRGGVLLNAEDAQTLHLQRNEEFPRKDVFMVEELIDRAGAAHFLEITGGLLTHLEAGNQLRYQVFEPSEALATGEVLSLEEKFLAGEGQNITPARYDRDARRRDRIALSVRAELERVARILNVQGYCRTDAFVRVLPDGQAETIVIEVNSLPGMTPATCIFHQAALEGMKPYEFIDAILEFGRARKLAGGVEAVGVKN